MAGKSDTISTNGTVFNSGDTLSVTITTTKGVGRVDGTLYIGETEIPVSSNTLNYTYDYVLTNTGTFNVHFINNMYLLDSNNITITVNAISNVVSAFVNRLKSVFVQKSNTRGLLKNDGTVDTTAYSTFDGNYNNLTNKPTIPTIPTNVSAFNNDNGYLTAHQDITGKEDISNKVTSIDDFSTDDEYPSAKAVYDVINTGTITPTNKNFITTSFTPFTLITDGYGETVNNNNSFTLVSNNKIHEEIIGAYCKFDFGCQNNEYYEFDITISKGSADIYDSESEISYYHLYRDAICTIKITHDELIVHEIDIDKTTVIDLSNSDGILTFSTKPSIRCQLDFSNKKWYHEATFFDKIYPIGCVHITTNSVNPSNYFDGEWERIQDTFLLASGTTYENGSTGGSATVTLTSAQSGVPAHSHKYQDYNTTYTLKTTNRKPGTSTAVAYGTSLTADGGATERTSSNNTAANASQAHENMPPYLAVYMWERVG